MLRPSRLSGLAGGSPQPFVNFSASKGTAEEVANHRGAAQQAEGPATQRAPMKPAIDPLIPPMGNGLLRERQGLAPLHGPTIEPRGGNPKYRRRPRRAQEHSPGRKFRAEREGTEHRRLPRRFSHPALSLGDGRDVILDGVAMARPRGVPKARQIQKGNGRLRTQPLSQRRKLSTRGRGINGMHKQPGRRSATLRRAPAKHRIQAPRPKAKLGPGERRKAVIHGRAGV